MRVLIASKRVILILPWVYVVQFLIFISFYWSVPPIMGRVSYILSFINPRFSLTWYLSCEYELLDTFYVMIVDNPC